MDQGSLYTNGQLSRSFTRSSSVRGQYSIFISHQGQDSIFATRLAVSISRSGTPCYVDELDLTVDGNDPRLESYLRDVIRDCRGLLAVVSVNTSGSWWVPLEIGVALESGKHIATYEINNIDLPSYLWLWPVMTEMPQAIQWADATRYLSATNTHNRWRLNPRRQRFQRDAFFSSL